MAMMSTVSRSAPLKTYSRRVNNTTEKPPGKRKLSEDSKSVVGLPPAKKFARSSIQSYFQPLSSASSPVLTRSSTLHSSDNLESRSPPLSSTPPEAISPSISSRRPQRPKRRLSTKPKLQPTTKMAQSRARSSSICSQCIEDHMCDMHRDSSDFGYYIDNDAIIRNTSSGYVSSSTSDAIPVARIRHDSGLESSKQTYLAPTQVSCKDCKFRYDGSQASDRKAHQGYHEDKINCGSLGVKLYDATVAGSVSSVIESGLSSELRCIQVTRSSASGLRAFARRVLDMVNKALGHSDDNEIGHYLVFVYMVELRPVAVAVVEPVTQAGAYTRRIPATGSQLQTTEQVLRANVTTNVKICVDRLWVHEDFRRGAFGGRHFASELLDFVRTGMHLGYTIPKLHVAFSIPTNQGYNFACSYFAGVFCQVFPGVNTDFLVHEQSV